jgi:pyruvate formate lyase activating enzyme
VTLTEGVVFDVKRYATDDGPGIRTTVFLKGCPLRCSWCHNPEGQVTTSELMYRKKKCLACFECAKACPTGALTHRERHVSINRRLCNLCGKCLNICPADAIKVAGKTFNEVEVMKEIEKDRAFYEESNGGVTFSGGEPLMQVDFLNCLLAECRKENIHTAVDTCGYSSRRNFAKIMNKVDVFLYDIKLMDDRTHKKYTGVSNKLILENLTELADKGKSILARFPLIPGINDDERNVSKTGEFLYKNGIEDIHVLPYHGAGAEKYRNLGRKYKLNRVKSPSDEELRLIKQKLQAFGLKVRIGGG